MSAIDGGPARASFTALGTTAELLVFPADALGTGLMLLEDELAAVDKACSRFRDDSELMALSRSPGLWTEVSALLFAALKTAVVAADQTGGAVDPTVGRSLRALGYDRDFTLVAPFGPDLTATPRARPCWRQVELDESGPRARLGHGVELDLGATAKALASDRAALRVSEATGAGVLVSLGGDVSISGPPPPGGWLVRVTDDHRGPASAPGQTVTLASGGLATSSTVTRSWQRGGRRLHHIVDPATGFPAQGPWRTVSVAAASCVDANTASTAALVNGNKAVGWLTSTGLPARLVAHSGPVIVLNRWPEDQAGEPV